MHEHNRSLGVVAAGLTLIVVLAIAGVVFGRSSDAETQPTAASETAATPVVDIAAVYDPFTAGDPLPDGFRQLLARDQIAPVYDPEFTSAGKVDWPAGMLILGVEGTETSKAYPITHLNQREMVIDDLDGLPILVSW